MAKIGGKEAHMRAMREGRAKIDPAQKQERARTALAQATAKSTAKKRPEAGVVIGKKHIMPAENVVSMLATKASTVEGMPLIQRDAAYVKSKKPKEAEPCQQPYIPRKYGIIGRLVVKMAEARGDIEKLEAVGKELHDVQPVRTYHAMAERFLTELIDEARTK